MTIASLIYEALIQACAPREPALPHLAMRYFGEHASTASQTSAVKGHILGLLLDSRLLVVEALRRGEE